MSKCLCGCERELPESKGKPRKFYSDSCRMKYNRQGESERTIPSVRFLKEETNEFVEKANKIENEHGKPDKKGEKANKPEKANILTPKQREDLLKQKKRAVWGDVLANPDQKYMEAVMESCGGAPNALYAADARSFVEKEKKAGRWDHERRFKFREEIF